MTQVPHSHHLASRSPTFSNGISVRSKFLMPVNMYSFDNAFRHSTRSSSQPCTASDTVEAQSMIKWICLQNNAAQSCLAIASGMTV